MATVVDIKYADLVIPLSSCPFSGIDEECPFRAFWDLPEFDSKIKKLEALSPEEIDLLRKYHEACLNKKITRKQNLARF